MVLTQVCVRPGCGQPLKSGKEYCSSHCAAADRARKRGLEIAVARLSPDARDVIPPSVSAMLTHALGDGALPIIEEMAQVLLQEKIINAPPLDLIRTTSGIDDGRYGTLVTSSGKSYRPTDSLDYATVDDMFRNGQVLFAHNMKSAGIQSALRNDRTWSVRCDDKRMKEVVRAVMDRVFQRYAGEFMLAMPYGAAFFEKEWTYEDSSFWGMEKVRGEFYGYRGLESIHPASIKAINFTEGGNVFDGFTQNKTGSLNGVDVGADTAFILTYNKKFRNLWGDPSFDPTYPYWFWQEIALRSFLRYLERTGTPVTVCWAPSRGKVKTPDGTLVDNMKYAILVAGYASKSNAIAMPSDVDTDTNQKLWSLEYLTDDKRGDQFITALERLDTYIMRSQMLADRVATQGQEATGSFAMSWVHLLATSVHNEHVLHEFLNQINDSLVEPIVRYNGSRNTPSAVIETEGLDLDEKERLFKLISVAGNQAGAESMKKIDWETVYNLSGIPTLSAEEIDALYETEMQRTIDRDKAMAKAFPQKAAPEKAPGQFPQADEKKPQLSPEAQKVVQQSYDYMLWQVSSGATAPLALTNKQALEIADKFKPRDRIFDFGATKLSEDDQLDEIRKQVLDELGVSDKPQDIQDQVWAAILAKIGVGKIGATLELSDEIISLGFGEWLKGVLKKAGEVVNKVVKKITGRSVGEWKDTLFGSGKYEKKSAGEPIVVTRADGTTYTWDPEAHPRDETGRWAQKGTVSPPADQETPLGPPELETVIDVSRHINKPKYDFLSGDDWPGRDLDKGTYGVFEIDGCSYTFFGQTTKEDVVRLHETNLRMAERAAALGYETRSVPMEIFNFDDFESMKKKFSGLNATDAVLAKMIKDINGQAAFYNDEKIILDMKVINNLDKMEPVLFHETLHGQDRSDGEVFTGSSTDAFSDEITTTLITMEYGEKYGFPLYNGYPVFVSWAVHASNIAGMSKSDLYQWAIDLHKKDGKGYYDAVLEFVRSGGININDPWLDWDANRGYLEEMNKTFGDWKEPWKAIAEIYGFDFNVLVEGMGGEQ
jgi:hypothetical protein